MTLTGDSASNGVIHFGTYDISPATRLSAIKYSAEAYKRTFIDFDSASNFEPRTYAYDYHGGHSLMKRGTVISRGIHAQDLSECSLDLTSEQEARLKAYWDKDNTLVTWGTLDPDDPIRKIIRGTHFMVSETRSTDDRTKAGHYERGWYLWGRRAINGIVIGRINFDNLSQPSMEGSAVIDSAVRKNFLTVQVPSEDIEKPPAGCLWMRTRTGSLRSKKNPVRAAGAVSVTGTDLPGGPVSIEIDAHSRSGDPSGFAKVVLAGDDKPIDIKWTLAANVDFILGGIHENRAFSCGSPRTPESMWKADDSGLTVTGIEHAMIWGSGNYELHTSDIGEEFRSLGALPGIRYNLMEESRAVEDYSEDSMLRGSLSFLHDVRAGLEEGEVIVQTPQIKFNGEWVDRRTRINSPVVSESYRDTGKTLSPSQTLPNLLRRQLGVLGRSYLLK